MKKIILFGGTGQLGHDIQTVFLNDGNYKVESLSSADFNFSSEDSLQEYLKEKLPFDILINAMALSSIEICELNKDLAYRINHQAVQELSEFCKSQDITIFHFSTDFVFDGKKKCPYTEDDQTSPISIYGSSKLAGELELYEICEKYFIFRVSTYFGAVAGGNNFVLDIIKKINLSEEIRVINDQFMNANHSLDIAKVVYFFIQNEIKDYGLFHCTSEEGCTWYDIALEIIKFKKIKYTISGISHLEDIKNLEKPVNSVLDVTKLSKYYKLPHWKESLRDYLNLIKD
jgi:dTDP-4-dehydrorhamnose reductase